MSSPSNITRRTTTGDVVAGSTAWVRSFTVTAGSTAASADLRAGGSGGTVLASLTALANTSESVQMDEAQFVGGVHLTLTGTGASASVAWI